MTVAVQIGALRDRVGVGGVVGGGAVGLDSARLQCLVQHGLPQRLPGLLGVVRRRHGRLRGRLLCPDDLRRRQLVVSSLYVEYLQTCTAREPLRHCRSTVTTESSARYVLVSTHLNLAGMLHSDARLYGIQHQRVQ